MNKAMTSKHKRGIMSELMSEFLIEHGWTDLPAETNPLAEWQLFGFADDGYDRWESPEGEIHLSLESAYNAQKRIEDENQLEMFRGMGCQGSRS